MIGLNDVIDDLTQFIDREITTVVEGAGPKTGPVRIVTLVRHSHSGDVEVHSMMEKHHNWGKAAEMGADFLQLATRDARGIVGGGAIQYSLVVVREGGKVCAQLPFIRTGAPNVVGANGSLATEAPTPTGLTQMSMRLAEITVQGAVAERAAILQVMSGMIREQRAWLHEMTTESRELFLGLRKLAIETAATQQDMAIKVIGARKNAALAHEAFKMLPAALNGLSGREIFPSGTADTVHLRNLMRMFDDEQLRLFAKAASAHGPEAEAAVALLVARLAEIRKEEEAEAVKLREVTGDRHPDEEAAELDAAGMIDPRQVLTSALGGGTNGTNGKTSPPVGEKIVKQLEQAERGREPRETAAAPPDAFVHRLFEGAGTGEIQLLSQMYDARGLHDVARELRERFAAFQKDAK